MYKNATSLVLNGVKNMVFSRKHQFDTSVMKDMFRRNNKISFIGWGPQASAQSMNMRDSIMGLGLNNQIKIGIRENSKSINDIIQSGFKPVSIDDAIKDADIVMLLISDSAQVKNYKNIISSMKSGSTLGLSHGFLVGYMESIKDKFRHDIDVIGMCPKGMGETVRQHYLRNSGINSSIAIEQDYTGNAMETALGWAFSVGSPYVFTTTLTQEYRSDIFGERGILLGGLYGIVDGLGIYAMNKGFNSKDAYNLTAKYITGDLSNSISKYGIKRTLDNKNVIPFIDEFYKSYVTTYPLMYNLLEEIYDEVKSGNEIHSVILANDRYDGKDANLCMPPLSGNINFWNSHNYVNNEQSSIENQSNNSEMVKSFSAGVYISAMVAQADVLANNGHQYSEIVNESVTEAVDSLNPHMYRNGIDYMVDHCSITARIGTRKWGPRFSHLMRSYIINPLPFHRSELDRYSNMFENNELHNAIEKLSQFTNK